MKAVVLFILLSLIACAEVSTGSLDASTDQLVATEAARDSVSSPDVGEVETSVMDGALDEPMSVSPDVMSPFTTCNDVEFGNIVNVIDFDRTGEPPLLRGAFRDGTYSLVRVERYLGIQPRPSSLARAAYTIRIQGNSIQLANGISETPIGVVPPTFSFLRMNFEIQTPNPFDPRPARAICPDPKNVNDIFRVYEQREDSFLLWWTSGVLFHFRRVGPP